MREAEIKDRHQEAAKGKKERKSRREAAARAQKYSAAVLPKNST
jgi:hypothetical protein